MSRTLSTNIQMLIANQSGILLSENGYIYNTCRFLTTTSVPHHFAYSENMTKLVMREA